MMFPARTQNRTELASYSALLLDSIIPLLFSIPERYVNMAHDTLIPYSTSSAHNAPNVFRILLAKSFWTHFLLGVFGNAIGRNLVIVNHNSMLSRHFSQATLVVVITLLVLNPCCWSLSLSSSSSFHGTTLQHAIFTPSNPYSASGAGSMTMRKQKASDRRTRRMQRGGGEELALQETIQDNIIKTITSSPMDLAQWKYKKVRNSMPRTVEQHKAHGRGRSRKRQTLYNSLASYHTKFLRLLTVEYQAEEEEVLGRIKASIDDPLSLEVAGHALYDLYPERRGNLFSDEVYRLVKAGDATLTYAPPEDAENPNPRNSHLPPNHKFSTNDVIMLTLQPQGSGDFFDPNQLPTSSSAISVEARVISTGPTYVDIALPGGAFEVAFGPAPNNIGPSGRGDARMRLRADRFFSNVPYTRMVAALTQLTAIPDRKKEPSTDGIQNDNPNNNKEDAKAHDNICMDDVLRETMIATHAFTDPNSSLFHDVDACDLQELGRKIAKPPMPTSVKLTNQALSYIQKNPKIFNPMNGPQLAAIGAALTRKMTLIQGPPGSGKTTVASAIAFGFTHQCRTISANAKVLSCAFSNVGADNLAEGFLRLGLKIVRVGKPSAVSENLWDYTLDAAIARDPVAQKAMQNAARATAHLAKLQSKKSGSMNGVISERAAKDIATAAVKASIKASNIAATKAFREADVIVSTSTGASDPRLMAACGLGASDSDDLLAEDQRLPGSDKKKLGLNGVDKKALIDKPERTDAPDGLPPLSMPFVIVDEACQSVEPASLIPMTASNSCRSLVLLGDPCQLPATVKSDPDSVLTVSLMERLAATLPQPSINVQVDTTDKDDKYLDTLAIKQARSMMRSMEERGREQVTYRKRFAGSLLLSVQYRMHPSIAAFASAMFYDSLLSTPSLLGSYRPFPSVLHRMMPCGDPNLGVRFINVGGRCNEKRGELKDGSATVYTQNPAVATQESTSYSNHAEAVRVVNLIKQIIAGSEKDPFAPKSIGVITPYNGQVQLIKRMIAGDEELRTLAAGNNTATIEVKSVDGYQGRERDVIIFSAVRSNRRGNLGFLTDWRRLNVAMTRARNALLVVGDMETLMEGDKHWAAFVKWCQGVHCVIDDTGNPEDCESL